MSSIDISTAQKIYKAGTESEMLQQIAKAHGCRLIYKYANDYGDKVTHTDYKIIMAPGDAQEQAFLNSPLIHNAVLVYRDGSIVPEEQTITGTLIFSWKFSLNSISEQDKNVISAIRTIRAKYGLSIVDHKAERAQDGYVITFQVRGRNENDFLSFEKQFKLIFIQHGIQLA